MTDRTLLILLVVFVVLGGAAYDRHLAAQGEISPIGRLIDFAGFSKRQASEPAVKTRVITKSYRYQLQDNLARLKEKHSQIEQQRTALINRRRDILRNLGAMSGEIQKEALENARLIERERQKFEEHFPEIKTLGEELMADYPGLDAETRRQRYEEMREKLLALWQDVTGAESREALDISSVFQAVEHVITEKETALSGECGEFTAQPSLPAAQAALLQRMERIQQCLGKKLDMMETSFLSRVDGVVDHSRQDVEGTVELSKGLNCEYDIISQNIDATEQQLIAGSEGLQGEFQRLVQSLVEVTEEDVLALMDLYEDLRQEQEVLLENLELNQQRFLQIYDEGDLSIKKYVKSLKGIFQLDFSELIRLYNDFIEEYQSGRNDLPKNETRLQQKMQEHWREDRNFISRFIDGAGFDLASLLEKRNKSSQQNGYRQEVVKEWEKELQDRRKTRYWDFRRILGSKRAPGKPVSHGE